MQVNIEKQTYCTITCNRDDGMRYINDVIKMLQAVRDAEIISKDAEIRHIFIKAPDTVKKMNKIEIEYKDTSIRTILDKKEG